MSKIFIAICAFVALSHAQDVDNESLEKAIAEDKAKSDKWIDTLIYKPQTENYGPGPMVNENAIAADKAIRKCGKNIDCVLNDLRRSRRRMLGT